MKVLFLLISLCLSLSAFSAEDKSTDAKEDAKVEVKYYRLYPDFVTNLKSKDQKHYVLVRIEVAAKGDKAIQQVKDNEALIRDKLILLFNNKTVAEVSRGKLRKNTKKQALELVQKTLKKETGEPLVTNLLFTKFQVE